MPQAVEENVGRTKEKIIDVSGLQITAAVILAPAPAAVGPHGVQEDLRRLRENSKLENGNLSGNAAY